MVKPVIRLKPIGFNNAIANFVNDPWKSEWQYQFLSSDSHNLIELNARKIFGRDNVEHWKELSKRKTQ